QRDSFQFQHAVGASKLEVAEIKFEIFAEPYLALDSCWSCRHSMPRGVRSTFYLRLPFRTNVSIFNSMAGQKKVTRTSGVRYCRKRGFRYYPAHGRHDVAQRPEVAAPGENSRHWGS